MKAFASFADESIQEIEQTFEALGPREVLLRVTHSGVCHTDVHLRQGYYDLGSRGHLEMKSRGITYPAVLGHETVGEVVEVGSSVTEVKAGDSRLVFPWLGCGECARCLEGQENACPNARALGVIQPGGYAEYIRVPDAKYLVDFGHLDPAWAATLACSGVTSYSAVSKVMPLAPDRPIAVIGAGGVGMMTINVLRALGHLNTIVLDANTGNLEKARELGASRTVLVEPGTTAQWVLEEIDHEVDAVIDFVNNSQTSTIAFDLLAKGGIMVGVGLFGGELIVPTSLLTTKMITIRGSYVGSLGELQKLVNLALEGVIPATPIQRGPLTLRGVTESLDLLEHGRSSGRIVLSPTKN